MNLTPKTFYVLTGVVGVVGLGLMWMTNSSISDQSAHIATLRKELRDEKEVQAELASAKTKVDKLKFDLVHLEQGVQDYAYIPTFLKEVEAFGKKNNLQIIQVKPIPSPPPTDKDKANKKEKAAYQELNISIKGRGSYEDSLRFLQAIKIFPKIVAVRTVSLAPHIDNSAKKALKPLLELDLELRAYAFKDEDKPVAQDAPKTAANQNAGGKHES